MLVLLGVLLVLIGAALIWFHIPYSPLQSGFKKDVAKMISENKLSDEGDVFTKEDFTHLPAPLQRYIEHCGYLGTPKMSYLKVEYHDVDFIQGRNRPKLKIDYTQYNFIHAPCRLALIDSSMFGIPFEGYDYYQDGAGGMKGVIAKAIPMFHQTGADMDRACLATYLAESLFAPTILLRDYITFEEISDHEVKAVITYGGQMASGIFSFNEDDEMISFTTNDRAATAPDGTVEYVPWSALCGGYAASPDGILHPTKFQAVWHYSDGDFIYFDGAIHEVAYTINHKMGTGI